MNRTRVHPRNIRRSVIASAIACCFAPAWVLANPVGPNVAHGQASFNALGKTLTVTNSPGAIINWKGFSIGAGETTRFVQQNAASAVLNRVVGKDATAIFGALQSNGRVFLINPNGILFGAGAQIDTAGLVASTLNMLDSDFIMGKMRFGDTPGAGALSNAGEIRTPIGGRVLLISPEGVENSGIIHSPKGEVILAAGKSVEIADSANPEVRVEISAPEARAVNLGKIVSESGKVGIYGGIVANRGIVSADSAVVGENGRIVFKATREASLEAGSITSANGPSGGSVEVSATGGTTLLAGSVQARGSAGRGGEVRLLGERVGLTGNGSVDVSGEHGGGTALVGGDLQGANAAVQNAQMTYVGANAAIKADAGASGDGGKVIVWADDTTRSYGHISARGGRSAGNGGFVETSGKIGLDVRRGPDVRAPAGKPGTWLLDPNDLTVVAGEGLDPALNTGAPFFAPLEDSSTIGVDLINAQLDFGSNVVLNTTSRGAGEGTQAGNITVLAPIVKTAETNGVFIGTTSLTLQAHNDIVIGPAAASPPPATR